MKKKKNAEFISFKNTKTMREMKQILILFIICWIVWVNFGLSKFSESFTDDLPEIDFHQFGPPVLLEK